MKSDLNLKKDIEAELSWDVSINPANVGVSVDGGVVTLSGHIDNFAQKTAIEKAVKRVSGVQAIAVELDVKLDPLHQRSDTDIAKAAESALDWHTLVPRDSITASVEKGWVKLTGEVDWEYQRANAANAVRDLVGVIGVINLVTLKARAQLGDVSSRIREALARQASRDAARITPAIDGHTVTLKGNGARGRSAAPRRLPRIRPPVSRRSSTSSALYRLTVAATSGRPNPIMIEAD